MRTIVFVGAVLILSGCRSGNKYADQLGLSPIDPPEVLKPVDARSGLATGSTYSEIEHARTAADFDSILADLKKNQSNFWNHIDHLQALPIPVMDLGVEKRQKLKENSDREFSLFEQAVLIKRAEVKDGDLNDADGEVAQRLDWANKYRINTFILMYDKPTASITS